MKLLNASNFSSYSTIIWRVEGKNSKILVGNTYNSIHIVSVNNERMFLYYTVKYNGNLIYQKKKLLKEYVRRYSLQLVVKMLKH